MTNLGYRARGTGLPGPLATGHSSWVAGVEMAAEQAAGSEALKPAEKVKNRYRRTFPRYYLGRASGR